MLTGQPPFRGQSAFEVALQHVQSDPVPLRELRPDLPSELIQVIEKLMAKDPARRYPSSQELLADLARFGDSSSGVGLGSLGTALGQSGPISTHLVPVAMPVAQGRRFRLGRKTLLALSLIAALLLGSGLRLWRGTASTKLAPSTALSSAREAVRMNPVSREASLQAALKKEVNLRDPEEFRRQLDAAVQLGTLYLDQRRLDEADAFFKELREKPPGEFRIYTAWGRIGQAAVLAFQNKAEESNKLFLELEKFRPPMFDKGRPGGDWGRFMKRGPLEAGMEMSLMMFQPAVRRIVVEALNYNAANLPEPLPAELERLRKLPNPSGRPPGIGMPPGGIGPRGSGTGPRSQHGPAEKGV
jgi:serine/threonine-protein kinase